MCCGMLATLITLKCTHPLASTTHMPWLSHFSSSAYSSSGLLTYTWSLNAWVPSRFTRSPLLSSLHSSSQSSPYPQFQLYPKWRWYPQMYILVPMSPGSRLFQTTCATCLPQHLRWTSRSMCSNLNLDGWCPFYQQMATLSIQFHKSDTWCHLLCVLIVNKVANSGNFSIHVGLCSLPSPPWP